MKTSPQTLLARANAAFQNKDFDSALALYEEALISVEEPLATQVRFNRDMALKKTTGHPSLKKTPDFKLRPQHQIEIYPDNEGRWTSLGNDPYFIIDPQAVDGLKAGWYQIDFTIETTHKIGFASIYYDYGHGMSEDKSVTIRYKNLTSVSRIIKFENNVKLLRFDPQDHPGKFNILNFCIHLLPEEQALSLMLSALKGERKDNHKPLIDESEAPVNSYNQGEYSIDRIFREYKDKLHAKPGAPSYQQWIDEVEIPSLPSETETKTALEHIQTKPLISIVVPTYNTVERHLRACIESVINQSYPNWELCISDDASPMPHVRRVLEEYKRLDRRIKVVYRPENGHISRASNSALELATGDYVALLDHDDELPGHALYFVVLAINQAPDTKIIYSDEDKIDEYGNRVSPHFKSDWSPDLFYSQNYVCHLSVYKRELLSRINGFRAGVEGSQDQDLLLRCLPHIQGTQIVHIPRVLYHWRAEEGSTALASGEKSYTTEAGIKALRDHFSTVNSDVRIEAGLVPNTYRVRWPIPDPAPLVSLLIPTRDHRELTETCVRSILDKSTYTNYEILILDNGSVEPTTLSFFKQIQREDKRVHVLRYDHPFNYSAINNFGVLHSRGEIVGLINNDIEVISPEWLSEMVSHAIRSDIGCVGAKLYYDNDTLQHAGVILSLGGVAGHSHKHFKREDTGYFSRLTLTQALSAVTGACLLVRRSIYDAVSGLDDENLKIAFNDVDFCLKVRNAGYRNLWTPYAELYHHESISRGHEDTPEKKERFRREVEFMQTKWGESLKTDPYYNPNLTKRREDFTIGM
jgi:glycosyltransferase involved in cell wall biosynthesis